MLYRKNTALDRDISVIGFGGAAVSGEGAGYGFGLMSEAQAEALLRDSWEAGINLFDTAPIYGFGLSEERFGKYLPPEAIIVTKGGVGWHPNKRVNMSNDPAVIEKMLKESLLRLKREQIDIYMIHWPDERVDIRRPMEILKKYLDKKVIKHIGLCNTHLTDLSAAQEIAPISFLQSELNALNTQAFDKLDESWKNYFTMSWGTLDKGILSARVTETRKFDASDARSWAPWWNKKEVSKKIIRVCKLQEILSEHNISLFEFAVHFNLYHFNVSNALIGFKSSSDVVDISSCLQKNISESIIREVLKQWNE